MSVVTYTATRRIERTAFRVVADDISAAAGDNSFNAVATSLLGLFDDEWIEVSGFATPSNNGWFQVAGDSTESKIVQDTAALVDEAAGATITIQGHVRGLGQGYAIEFTPRQLDSAFPEVVRNQVRALDGSAETLLHRIDETADVNSGRIAESQVAHWEEFLASVAAGESFDFDAFGSIAAPDNPRAAELTSTRHARTRIGTTRRYVVPFRLRYTDA